jgi:hypothetical protein
MGFALRRMHVSAFSAWTFLVSSLKPTRIRVNERASLSRAKYCRSYAAELRAIAVHVKLDAARQTLLKVASDFDRMADEAEALAQSKMLPKRPRLDS